MAQNELPQELGQILAGSTYARSNPDVVAASMENLGVEHAALRAFMTRFEGPFWSEHLGIELLDLCEGDETIVSATEVCRNQFGFSKQFLVLSRFFAGQVVVLDTSNDKVYEVDFEGGEKLLLQGSLAPRWASFHSFLIEYFTGQIDG